MGAKVRELIAMAFNASFGRSKWEGMFGRSTDWILAFLVGVATRAPYDGDVIEFQDGRWVLAPNANGGISTGTVIDGGTFN